MALHGLVRQDQLLRNFLGGHALRQQLQNLLLAPGEGLDHGSLCGGRYGRLRLWAGMLRGEGAQDLLDVVTDTARNAVCGQPSQQTRPC